MKGIIFSSDEFKKVDSILYRYGASAHKIYVHLYELYQESNNFTVELDVIIVGIDENSIYRLVQKSMENVDPRFWSYRNLDLIRSKEMSIFETKERLGLSDTQIKKILDGKNAWIEEIDMFMGEYETFDDLFELEIEGLIRKREGIDKTKKYITFHK